MSGSDKEREKEMGKVKEPQPVMLFVGMLSKDPALLDELAGVLGESFGPLLHLK